MKLFLATFFTCLLLVSFAVTVSTLHAAEPVTDSSGTIDGAPDSSGSGGGSNVAFELKNPLKAKSLQCLLFFIINGVMAIVAVLAGLYIMWSGFLFVAARGSPDKLTEARKAFMNAIIGTAILLGAWAITSLVVNVVNSVSHQPVITSLPTGANCPG